MGAEAAAEHTPADALDRLVAKLDDESTKVAEEAQAGLTEIGVTAAERLVERLDGLSDSGKLCAIEVLSAVPVSGAAEALTRLLGDEDSTVREWAAYSLGDDRNFSGAHVENAGPASSPGCL